ncbi:MAG: VRR-NUC domain-containing protein [Candidatus Pacearchaeota archaeon]|jgi:hypothetical protein
MTSKTSQKILSEYDEQCLLVQYLELKKIRFSKVAQETYTSNWGIVAKNKKSGLRKGVPDLIIIIPGNKKNHLIFIEMKKKKGSSISQEQKDWWCDLNKCEGVKSFICHGFDDAKEIIDLELLIA